ncbi:MAG: HAMP domain-containing sensor histidine kinase, partial [Patescibacteria group bacterium]
MFPDIKISKSQGGNVVDAGAINLLEQQMKGFDLEGKLKLVVEKGHYIEVEGVDIADSIFDIDLLPIGVDDGAIGSVVLFDDVTEKTVMQRSKDEFFSIASHELRTPLTAIRGNTSMILNYYEKQLKDPELKEMVTDIHASSLRLIEIVNDFLDTSRLEQGKMVFNLTDISLTKLIEEVVKETNIVAGEQGNKVVFEEPEKPLPLVSADMNKLKQVIYNMVGNSLKFTENGVITLKPEKKGSHIKVSVTDTGRGISEESKVLLFRKFQQATSSLITRDTTKGTGLGLYISKLILDNMDGSIGIDRSEVGVGSTFYFTIPIAKGTGENKTK